MEVNDLKPLIGITVNEDNDSDKYFLTHYYSRAVEKAGGLPVLLPLLEKRKNIKQMIDLLDGLILPGGVDVDPVFMGEEPLRNLGQITPNRDKFELELAKRALDCNLSILAICRGIQLLNMAAGGTIYQDILCQIKHDQQAPKWYPTHKVKIKKGSQLYSLAGVKEIRVNSFHHQAVAKAAPGFFVTATSYDGIVEAIESENHKFVLGVQWHPECMWEKDEQAFNLFQGLIDSTKKEN